jgi:hypothetical protein
MESIDSSQSIQEMDVDGKQEDSEQFVKTELEEIVDLKENGNIKILKQKHSDFVTEELPDSILCQFCQDKMSSNSKNLMCPYWSTTWCERWILKWLSKKNTCPNWKKNLYAENLVSNPLVNKVSSTLNRFRYLLRWGEHNGEIGMICRPCRKGLWFSWIQSHEGHQKGTFEELWTQKKKQFEHKIESLEQLFNLVNEEIIDSRKKRIEYFNRLVDQLEELEIQKIKQKCQEAKVKYIEKVISPNKKFKEMNKGINEWKNKLIDDRQVTFLPPKWNKLQEDFTEFQCKSKELCNDLRKEMEASLNYIEGVKMLEYSNLDAFSEDNEHYIRIDYSDAFITKRSDWFEIDIYRTLNNKTIAVMAVSNKSIIERYKHWGEFHGKIITEINQEHPLKLAVFYIADKGKEILNNLKVASFQVEDILRTMVSIESSTNWIFN